MREVMLLFYVNDCKKYYNKKSKTYCLQAKILVLYLIQDLSEGPKVIL